MKDQMYTIKLTNGKEMHGLTLNEVKNFVEGNNYLLDNNASHWGIDKQIKDAGEVGIFETDKDQWGVGIITPDLTTDEIVGY